MQVLFFTFSSWPRARHVLTWNKKCAHGLALQLSGKPWSNMPSIYVNVNFYKFYYTFPGGSKNNPGNKKNSWCVFVSVHVLPSIFGTLLFTIQHQLHLPSSSPYFLYTLSKHLLSVLLLLVMVNNGKQGFSYFTDCLQELNWVVSNWYTYSSLARLEMNLMKDSWIKQCCLFYSVPNYTSCSSHLVTLARAVNGLIERSSQVDTETKAST